MNAEWSAWVGWPTPYFGGVLEAASLSPMRTMATAPNKTFQIIRVAEPRWTPHYQCHHPLHDHIQTSKSSPGPSQKRYSNVNVDLHCVSLAAILENANTSWKRLVYWADEMNYRFSEKYLERKSSVSSRNQLVCSICWIHKSNLKPISPAFIQIFQFWIRFEEKCK